MRSYAEKEIISHEELKLFVRARTMVHGLTVSEARNFRCHELAEAVGRLLGLRRQDGHYGCVEHSWLWTRAPSQSELESWGKWSHDDRPKILDVYTPGTVPMVQLRDTFFGLKPGDLYHLREPSFKLDQEAVRGLVAQFQSIDSLFWPPLDERLSAQSTKSSTGDSPPDPSKA